MAKPPYLTIMLLNPIESSIQHNGEETLAHQEDSLIISTSTENNSSNDQRILVPKKKLAKVLWLTVSLAVAHSCLSFTLSIPKLQHYYRSSFITISSAVWALPPMAVVVVPIFVSSFEKLKNSLVPLMIAAFANALGCAIKCTGTEPNGYPIVIAGQLINMLALPASLGYLFVLSKQFPKQKWPITLLWITTITLGSISGICLLPLLLAEEEKSEDIGLQIYKYFLWNAFASIIPLVLIPFVLKEQHQFSGTNYQVFSANSEIVNAGENQHEQICISSLTSRVNSLKSSLPIVREKQFIISAIANGVSLGLFLNMFVASTACIDIEAKIIWKLCFIESSVVPTFSLCFLAIFRAKLNTSMWLMVGNNTLLTSSAIIINLCKEFTPLSVQLFLIYCLHVASGLNYFVLVKKSLLHADSMKTILAMIIAQCLLTSLACVFQFVLLWRFSIVIWTASFCILSFTSFLSLFASS